MQIELKNPQEKAEETYAIGDVLLVSQDYCREEVVMLCNFGGKVSAYCLRNGNHYTSRPADFNYKHDLGTDVVEYVIGSVSKIIRKLNVKLVEV